MTVSRFPPPQEQPASGERRVRRFRLRGDTSEERAPPPGMESLGRARESLANRPGTGASGMDSLSTARGGKTGPRHLGATIANPDPTGKRFGARQHTASGGETPAEAAESASVQAPAVADAAAKTAPVERPAIQGVASAESTESKEPSATPVAIAFERPSGGSQIVSVEAAANTDAVPVRVASAARRDTGPDPKDAELASKVLKASHQLQRAMDQAALAGIIIEPHFQPTPDRFAEFGSNVETFLCQIQMYRKLV